jgi:hypothetical protein
MRVIAAMCGIALSVVATQPFAETRVLTVDYVHANIAKLHGKTVRLRGQVNNCESLTCSICTSAAKEADCLPLSLYSDPAGRSEIEALYRFATITVDARINAACELGYDPANGRKPGELIVCTDRGSAVEEARVVSVDQRRAATEGRFDMYEGEPLQPATAEEGGPIIAGWRAQQKQLYPDEGAREIAVFRVSPEGRFGADAGYRLCVCRQDSCQGKWPSMSGQLIHSPGNPYECARADQVQAGWVFSY